MVSVSGFRGRVGTSLTPELVAGVAGAFGAFLRGRGAVGRVLVGRDSRTSGPMLLRAVVAGLQSVGRAVVELGMVPTPTLLLAVEEAGAAGGIVVTASHNPAEWNALKFVSAEGTFLDGETMEAFRTFLVSEDPPRAAWDALGEVTTDAGAVERHLRRILALPHLDPGVVRQAGLTVALDCVRGAAGPLMTRLLEALGCRVVGVGLEPDGRFPRDPEPTAANLGELGELVRRSGAALGLAVDPDGDRLSLVDESGEPLGEDLTLALAADVVLERTPGPVVTNLSTSLVVEDVARAHGAALHRAPVGEINVARCMQEVGAVVGGEGNGGVVLPDLHLTRDAPLGAALVLQGLARRGGSLSEWARAWPRYVIVKEKVSFPREALGEAFERLESRLPAPEVDRADGLRLAWPEAGRWLHVRPSGTEPVVRLIAEAHGAEEARALLVLAREVLEETA